MIRKIIEHIAVEHGYMLINGDTNIENPGRDRTLLKKLNYSAIP